MSFNYEPRGQLRIVPLTLTTTARTLAYPAPARMRPCVVVVNVVNRTGAAVAFTCELKRGVAFFAICAALPVPANGVYNADDIQLALLDGDEIHVTASTANALDVMLLVDEPGGPNN